jgi:hypothetical protein
MIKIKDPVRKDSHVKQLAALLMIVSREITPEGR